MPNYKRKKCSKCHKTFVPSSGHLKCPTCRAKERPRIKCIDCGESIIYDRERCRKCADMKQKVESNGNWKGGKTRHKAGYVLVRVPEHPRATKNCKYVFEHILVMEEELGRYLLPEEKIHHKNGMKSDNRTSNLEVWTTAHPIGARIKDLVVWAKELLGLYDPKALRVHKK